MSNPHDKTKYSIEPDASTFQTGSTNPPKNRTGLILILLSLVIFLGGIATALGLTNIRLFQALEAQQTPQPPAVGFSHGEAGQPTAESRQTGLGFCGETVSEFWHTYHDLPHGIFIQSVDENSDAAQQGVLPGDILTHVNGTSILAFEDLQSALHNNVEPVEIVLYRDAQQIKLYITPGD